MGRPEKKTIPDQPPVPSPQPLTQMGVKIRLPSRSRATWTRHGPIANRVLLCASGADRVRLRTCPVCRLHIKVSAPIVSERPTIRPEPPRATSAHKAHFP